MKHSNDHNNGRGARPQLKVVRFESDLPTATPVCIEVDFSEGKAVATPTDPTTRECREEEATMAPGTYRYCLVVDGERMPDPMTGEAEPEPYDGRNLFLRVVSLGEHSQDTGEEH